MALAWATNCHMCQGAIGHNNGTTGGPPNHPFVFSTLATHGNVGKQSARLYLACRCSALLLHVCQMGHLCVAHAAVAHAHPLCLQLCSLPCHATTHTGMHAHATLLFVALLDWQLLLLRRFCVLLLLLLALLPRLALL